MTIILANNIPILEGAITVPRVGAWFADITTSPLDVSEGDTVTIFDGGTEWIGTVTSGSLYQSRTTVRVVGGAGGLRSTIGAEHYKAAKVGQVLSSICSATGETASAAIDRAVSTSTLPFWSRYRSTGGTAIDELAAAAGVVWRVLPSGVVWLGSEAEESEAPFEAQVLNYDPGPGTYTIAPEGIGYTPGMTQSAGTISRVEYSISSKLRATYWVL